MGCSRDRATRRDVPGRLAVDARQASLVPPGCEDEDRRNQPRGRDLHRQISRWMYLHIEEPARVREEREYMEHRDAHGPEAMRKKREQGGCGRTKQVDREMPRVQRCEFDRYELVQTLVRSHQGPRDRGHTPCGSER